MSEFQVVWKSYADRTEQALKSRLPKSSQAPERLHQAMSYVCLDGGKRFRASLVYACGEMVGADLGALDTPASAVEMVHAYSLTHDDLPAMDDDMLRRGRATCHIEFDEATAVLVGDALQSRAFEILASNDYNQVTSDQRSQMIGELATAVGSMGMAGGQALDMEATGSTIDFDALVKIHRLKTGALIESAAVIGIFAAPQQDTELVETIREYASALGLAFQITDDILDHTSDVETLGKSTGADESLNKATYVSILGLDAAKAHANKLSDQAIESIRGLGDNRTYLEQLAKFVVNRNF